MSLSDTLSYASEWCATLRPLLQMAFGTVHESFNQHYWGLHVILIILVEIRTYFIIEIENLKYKMDWNRVFIMVLKIKPLQKLFLPPVPDSTQVLAGFHRF